MKKENQGKLEKDHDRTKKNGVGEYIIPVNKNSNVKLLSPAGKSITGAVEEAIQRPKDLPLSAHHPIPVLAMDIVEKADSAERQCPVLLWSVVNQTKTAEEDAEIDWDAHKRWASNVAVGTAAVDGPQGLLYLVVGEGNKVTRREITGWPLGINPGAA